MIETVADPMNGHVKLIGVKVVDPTPISTTHTNSPGVEAQAMSSQVHDLLIESVGKIADEWVQQLTTLRNSATELEQQILTYVSRTRHDISALHDLGIKVAAEAARGQAVCKELRAGLEKIFVIEMHDNERIYRDMAGTVSDAELREVKKLTLAWAKVGDKLRPTVRILFLTCINLIGTMGPAFCRLAAANLIKRANETEGH